MAEFELLEERVISGKGVLRVPEPALDARVWIMYVDLIRPPSTEYKEFLWNPPQSMYARMSYLRSEYVQTYDLIRFEREQRTYINDITGQNLRAIKCAYEGILTTFFNLGNALSLPSISVTNLIKDYESLALSWDQVLFSCYGSTALQVRFFGLNFDTCNPENDKTKRLPPPPPPRPRVPPNTPITDISPPYDADPDTDPFTGDEFDDGLPDTTVCAKYAVFVRIFAFWGDPDGTEGGFTYKDFGRQVWGEVFGLTFQRAPSPFVAIDCQGDVAFPCGSRQDVQIVSGNPVNPYPDPYIVNIIAI